MKCRTESQIRKGKLYHYEGYKLSFRAGELESNYPEVKEFLDKSSPHDVIVALERYLTGGTLRDQAKELIKEIMLEMACQNGPVTASYHQSVSDEINELLDNF